MKIIKIAQGKVVPFMEENQMGISIDMGNI